MDVKEHIQEFSDVIRLGSVPQKVQPPPPAQKPQTKGEPSKRNKRDPRIYRRLSVIPGDFLYGASTSRMADTTNVSQGAGESVVGRRSQDLMETSADLDEEGKLVINLV